MALSEDARRVADALRVGTKSLTDARSLGARDLSPAIYIHCANVRNVASAYAADGFFDHKEFYLACSLEVDGSFPAPEPLVAITQFRITG